MNIPKAILGFCVTMLVFYLTISYIVWDITWISDMNTWDQPDRFISLLPVLASIMAGGIVGAISSFD